MGRAAHRGSPRPRATPIRALAVILVLITPWTLLAYLVASFAIPERQPHEPRVRAERITGLGDAHPALLVGGVIVAVLLFDDAWFLHPFPAAVALVAVGVWLLTRDRDRPPSNQISNAEGDSSTTMASGPAPTDTPIRRRNGPFATAHRAGRR